VRVCVCENVYPNHECVCVCVCVCVCAINGNRGATYCKLQRLFERGWGEEEEGLLGLWGRKGMGEALSLSQSQYLSLSLSLA